MPIRESILARTFARSRESIHSRGPTRSRESTGVREPTHAREVELYDRLDGDSVRCRVCPRSCVVPPGERGFCRVRENRDGEFVLVTYGLAVSAAVDPIEKKPLFHFAPGSRVLSVAARGCTLRCDFCQNYRIAIEHDDVPERARAPAQLVSAIDDEDCGGIAYTYTEPTVFLEYALDTMAETSEEHYSAFVTNGYMTPETVDLIAPRLDAVNVDLKGGDAFYRDRCGVPDPTPIYETIEALSERDVHLEVTTLLVTDENDDPDDIRERMRWIRSTLGPETPVHVSCFHPAYKMYDVPPTPIERLESALEIAHDEGLEFVYCGNVPGHEAESTYCPDCDALVVEREGFTIRSYDLEGGGCPRCGCEIPIAGTGWARDTTSGAEFWR